MNPGIESRAEVDPYGRFVPLGLVSGLLLALARWFPLEWLPLRACAFLEITGYPCPFCGTTRSFWAMARGEWGWAFHNSPLGALLFLGVAVLFVWSVLGISGIRLPHRGRPRGWIFARRLVLISLLLLLGNWAYRLVMGLR